MAFRPTRNVMMLAFDQCQILDVTGPLEILASANEIDRTAQPGLRYHARCRAGGAAVDHGGVRGGLAVADRAFGEISDDELARVHTFMVAGGGCARSPRCAIRRWSRSSGAPRPGRGASLRYARAPR